MANQIQANPSRMFVPSSAMLQSQVDRAMAKFDAARAAQAPCETNGDDEHNQMCPFCGALPQARCRYWE